MNSRSENFNAFSLLGIEGAEVPICRLLANLLESPEVGPGPFLSTLTGRDEGEVAHIEQARTEIGFAGTLSRRRADLLVDWLESDGTPRRLVVEVKLYAQEGQDQTRDYAASDWSKVARVSEQLGATDGAKSERKVDFAYLTLFGEDAEASHVFRSVRFEELAKALEPYAGLPDSRGVLTRDLVFMFGDASSRAQMDQSLSFRDGLEMAGHGLLDMRYRLFRQVCAEISSRAQLQFHGVYLGSGRGRSWFGAHVTSPHWLCEISWSESHEFFPERDWWLAFQPRLNFPINGSDPIFDLGLYLETAPYRSQHQLRSMPNGDALFATYKAIRGERVKLMAEVIEPEWRRSGYWNQAFAWRKLDLDLPMKELIDLVAVEMKRIAARIDDALIGKFPASI